MTVRRTYIITLLWCLAMAVGAADIHVQAGASLADALRQAREMRRLGQADTVTLRLEPGIYRLYEPLVVRPEDSHLRVVGPGAVLSGAMPITQWRQEGKLWVADVPDFNGHPVMFRQLWVNGRKAVKASDVAHFEQMARIRWVDKNTQELWIPAEAVTRYSLDMARSPYLELVLHEMWETANLRVAGLCRRGDSVAVTFHHPEADVQFSHPWPSPMYNSAHNSPFYLTNSLQLLDSPGEWYYDVRARKLYYMPLKGEDISTTVAEVPVLENLVSVLGSECRPVTDVLFSGLTFSYTTWLRPSYAGHVPLQAGMYLTEAYKLRPKMERPDNHKLDNQGWLGRAGAAVSLLYARDVNFSQCAFTHVGASALDYVYACSGGEVSRCTFNDIGMNGYVCGSFSPEGLETHLPYRPHCAEVVCSGQKVTNSLFENVGDEDWGCVAIAAGYVRDISIAHNTVCHVPYTGISLGWGWNRDSVCMRDNKVTGNLVYDYARHVYDCAGIYTLGSQPGTLITRNVVRDIARPSYVHDPEHWFYLYTDEGSSHITLKDNWTPTEKFLKNANGPGNVWLNNGPMVDPSIKAQAGIERK